MDIFFHHPDELRQEEAIVGFEVIGVLGVEGPGLLFRDIEEGRSSVEYQARLIQIARRVETEECLLGMSAHLTAAAKRV
ncbi:MAG TPA: hypothetical protein VLX61_11190 [Anaerolineales bacterium]|nr:hypothetical protein [Anaerolineales bacterium]